MKQYLGPVLLGKCAFCGVVRTRSLQETASTLAPWFFLALHCCQSTSVFSLFVIVHCFNGLSVVSLHDVEGNEAAFFRCPNNEAFFPPL